MSSDQVDSTNTQTVSLPTLTQKTVVSKSQLLNSSVDGCPTFLITLYTFSSSPISTSEGLCQGAPAALSCRYLTRPPHCRHSSRDLRLLTHRLSTHMLLTFTCTQVLWILSCLTRPRASGVTTRPATRLTVFSTHTTEYV